MGASGDEVRPAESRQSPALTVEIVAFAAFLDYFLYGTVIPLTPLFPAEVRSEAQAGLLYCVYSIRVLLVTPLFGYFGDTLGRRPAIDLRCVVWHLCRCEL